MKYIAFYLPQYHSIPENDEWWGKGFTEWTNVKKARPLYKNHYQPHIPLNENYYDLDIDFQTTMSDQIKMAKENGIYGFCFYHYWFKGGKKLLEKPLEKFLDNKEMNINFCVCWANEAWTRTWDGKERHVLMEQEYGNEEEWKEHIGYLLPFFEDNRYIKINNCPVLVIYRPELIEQLEAMVRIFRDEAQKAGYPDLFIVSQSSVYSNMKEKSGCIDAYILYEPGYTQNEATARYSGIIGSIKKSPNIFLSNVFNAAKTRIFRKLGIKNGKLTCTLLNYDQIWKRIIEREYSQKYTIIPGAFVDWDNSPRRGYNNSRIFIGASPVKFGKYMKKLTDKANKETKLDMIFINAWNEWGEGAHLEPDEKNGYGYLNAIKTIEDNNCEENIHTL